MACHDFGGNRCGPVSVPGALSTQAIRDSELNLGESSSFSDGSACYSLALEPSSEKNGIQDRSKVLRLDLCIVHSHS